MTNTNTNTNTNTFTSGEAYGVRKLEEFKDVDLASDQYLCRKIEKGTGLDSLGVIIPAVSDEVFVASLDNDTLLAGMREWLQEQIENVVKTRIAAGAATIIDADLGIEKVAEYLQAQEVKKGRVSKEKIAAWFDSSVADKLAAGLRAAIADISDEKVSIALRQHRDCFAKLSGRDVSLGDKVVANLRKDLELVQDRGALWQYLSMKLETAGTKTPDMLGL